MRKRLAALLLCAALAISVPGCGIMGTIFGFFESLSDFILDFILFNDAMKEGYVKGYSVLTRKSIPENWYPNLKR